MPGPSYSVSLEAVIDYRITDVPVKDDKGGDSFNAGFILEVMPPGQERFEVIPAPFIKALVNEQGGQPGQVRPNGTVLLPATIAKIYLERFVEYRNLPLDGLWTFTHRWVSMAGKVSDQEPYQKLYLDLNKPAIANSPAALDTQPAEGALRFGSSVVSIN